MRLDKSLEALLPVFAGFAREHSDDIVSQSKSQRFAKNARVFKQGAESGTQHMDRSFANLLPTREHSPDPTHYPLCGVSDGGANLDKSVLEALQAIDDPEIGVSIVDLGLVYAAQRDAAGVRAALTATSRSCPLGEFMREEARTRLQQTFPEAPTVDVELVWSPAWNPKRMNEAARRALGL